MVDHMVFADQIKRGARSIEQRTGQYLFNHLPDGAQLAVRGTLFDPFHKELTHQEIVAWLENHLIFKGQEIVGVFNNNDILWDGLS